MREIHRGTETGCVRRSDLPITFFFFKTRKSNVGPNSHDDTDHLLRGLNACRSPAPRRVKLVCLHPLRTGQTQKAESNSTCCGAGQKRTPSEPPSLLHPFPQDRVLTTGRGSSHLGQEGLGLGGEPAITSKRALVCLPTNSGHAVPSRRLALVTLAPSSTAARMGRPSLLRAQMRSGVHSQLSTSEQQTREEYKETFKEKMKASEGAFDKTKEALDLAAQDEAKKVSGLQEIVFKNIDYLRRIIASVGGQSKVTMSYVCPNCNSSPLEDYVWWVSG